MRKQTDSRGPCAVCGIALAEHDVMVCDSIRGWMHGKCYHEKVEAPWVKEWRIRDRAQTLWLVTGR